MEQPGSQARPAAVVDPVFEHALNDYIEQALTQAKKEYKPGIEPFSVQADKIRQKIREWFFAYQSSYIKGYQVLLNELAKILPEEKEGDPLAPFRLGDQGRKILDDPEAFTDQLAKGIPIFQIMGFTEEVLGKFYEAACHLVMEKSYTEAKDAFFFLVTIAPYFSQCWLGLGYCYLQCGENEAAIIACSRALDLDPSNADHYLTFARIFIQMKDFAKAKQVCDLGIVYAAEHPDEPWVPELRVLMEEAKRQIDEQAKKRQ